MVTVVDAKHIHQHWDSDEAQEQIAFADVILLNKVDLVTPEELDALETKIRDMNALVKIYRTQNSELQMDSILGVRAFDLDRALEIDPEFLGEDAHEHDESVFSLAFVENGALDKEKLNTWMSNLLETKGPDIFRMKGILNIQGEDNRFVFQGVHMIFDGKTERPWKPTETRKSELVFIGRDLNEAELRDGFRACLA